MAWNSSSATTTDRLRSAAMRPGSANSSLASRVTSRSVRTSGKATAKRPGPARLLFEADLGSRGGDGGGQPVARPLPARFRRRQRARIAFEERDVRAVGADGDLDGQQAAARQRRQRLTHERRLAVAARGDEEDLLPVARGRSTSRSSSSSRSANALRGQPRRRQRGWSWRYVDDRSRYGRLT